MPSLVGFNRKLVILNKAEDINSELLDNIKDSVLIINGELLESKKAVTKTTSVLHKIMMYEKAVNTNIIIIKSPDYKIDRKSLEMCGMLEKLPLVE